MTKRPVLTLLYSTASYDFNNVIGHKKDLNKLIQFKLKKMKVEYLKELLMQKNKILVKIL